MAAYPMNEYRKKPVYIQAAAESINRNRNGSVDKTTIPNMLSGMTKKNLQPGDQGRHVLGKKGR